MSILHRLPVELSQALSVSWLDLIDVAHLDSAVCVLEERAAFLSTIFASKSVYDYSQYFDKQNTQKGALFYKPEFQEWVLLRGVRLSSLVSFPRCEKDLKQKRVFVEILRRSGSCLKTVQTDMDFEVVKVALCTHCTVLERLTCGKVGKKGGFDRLLKGCPSLQHLSLEYMDSPAVEALQKVGARILSLRMATDRLNELQRPQWAALVPYLPNLTELEVARECPFDTVLAAVGEHCPLLRVLKVTSYMTTYAYPGFGSESTAPLLAIAQGCPQLERLLIDGNLWPSEIAMLALLRNCRKLVALHVENSYGLPEPVMCVLARDFPALRELEVRSWAYPGFRAPEFIVAWPLLERLSVGDVSATDVLMCTVAAHCRKLRYFVALDCKLVTDAGVTALAKGCAQLQSLGLHGCADITVAALNSVVTHCRYLESLTVQQSLQANDPKKITLQQAAPYLKLGQINMYTLAFLQRQVERGK